MSRTVRKNRRRVQFRNGTRYFTPVSAPEGQQNWFCKCTWCVSGWLHKHSRKPEVREGLDEFFKQED